jgi:hypothetical protein
MRNLAYAILMECVYQTYFNSHFGATRGSAASSPQWATVCWNVSLSYNMIANGRVK